MPHKPITGLSHQQFTTLLTALNNHLTWIKPDQKPRKLTLAQALKITLLYHRHNLTVNSWQDSTTSLNRQFQGLST